MGPNIKSTKSCFRGRFMQSDWKKIMLGDESLTELQSRVLQHGPASLAEAYVLGALQSKYLIRRGAKRNESHGIKSMPPRPLP
jgi:hypothetical protein